MSEVGIGILLLWTVLLGIWVIRLSAARLYPETPGVHVWITLRLLLRWGMGAFAVLTWESYHQPEPPPAYALAVESGCPEVWAPATRLAREAFARQHQIALLAITPRSAFWAIPPTQDSSLFFFLLHQISEAAEASTHPPATHAALRQLRSHMRNGDFVAVLWLGRFERDSLPYPCLPLCEKQEKSHEEIALPAPPLRTTTLYGLGFLLCGMLLLIGDGYFYLLRKHLPLSTRS